MKAIWNGAVLAESDETVVVDGNHYFPRASVVETHLRDSDHHSRCGWKGTANYFHLDVEGQVNRDAAWYYPSTKPAAKEIEGYVAFWRGVEIGGD